VSQLACCNSTPLSQEVVSWTVLIHWSLNRVNYLLRHKSTLVSSAPTDTRIQIFQREKRLKTASISLKHRFARLLGSTIFGVLTLGQPPSHAATDTARAVKYAQNDIVPVKAKLGFSTLIILPEKEEILDFTTGEQVSGRAFCNVSRDFLRLLASKSTGR